MSCVQTGSTRWKPSLLRGGRPGARARHARGCRGPGAGGAASAAGEPDTGAPASRGRSPRSAGQAPGSEFKWSWGNTLSYGLGFRLGDPDQRLIGLAAGGTAFSVNGDDGNQNYEKGIFTNAVKLTSELQFSYKSFGGFVRGFGFYDYENENGRPGPHAALDAAKDRVGSRVELRDAFVYGPLQARRACRASCARAGR